MTELKVTVTNKCAKAGNKSIVCDNTDYVIRFEFDEEWAELTTRTARFIWNNQYVDVVFEGNTCAVPSITSTNYLSVGVFAGDLKTTTPAIFSCRKSILSEGGKPSEPTPDVYAEIMRLLNEKSNINDVYTKAEADELLATKMGHDETYSKSEIDSMLDEKVSSDEVYSKSEVDEKISQASAGDVYTKSEIDDKLGEVYSKSEVDAKFSEIGDVDLSEVEEKIQQNTDDITQLKESSEKTDKAVSELAQRNLFTDEEKEKLSGLENYDDTLIKEQLGSKANSDDVYSKTEIDTMFGDVESVLATVVEV